MSQQDELRRLIGVVAGLRAAIPAIAVEPWAQYHASVAAHRTAAAAALEKLGAEEGAKTRDSWNGTFIILAGIRSSSTSGIAAALCNWQRAAEFKLKMEAK
ncbi:hypothetical protein [uncultured Martelella sp.]|uniref:hypothetical protein n=1 Tax=uncultured Martelella sp. TaxID=392331 RepID=UPI0029C83A29|nr:hypothetical protein [uncultured Martelella sp.]